MQNYTYSVFDLDRVGMPEDEFLNKMAHEGWDLFLINNEPQNEYPGTIVKLYFRKKKLSFLEQFFDFG